MSDGITPVRPVSRIEPINRILGIADMDPGLYQIAAVSLFALFQRLHPTVVIMPLPLSPISVVEAMQPRNKYRTRKKISKKDKRDF